jgi:methyl-accepting chemotaxis protein
MRIFHNLSIRWKLTLLLLVIVSVVMLLSSIAFVVNDVSMIKSSMQDQVSVLADVLGANSTAALSLNPSDAQEVLTSLRLQPDVVLACTYDKEGKIVATYKAAAWEGAPPSAPGPNGSEFTADGYLDVYQPIIMDKETLGTIYLRASMERLNAQLRRYVIIMAIVLVVSLIVSLVLSAVLQRVITGPIRRLVDAVKTVTTGGDYSIRVKRGGNDELGVLCDGFNSMLAQIEQRGTELQRSNADLERRGTELERTNADLDTTLKAVSQVVRQLTSAARFAADAGRDGRQAVDESITAMDTAQEQVESIAENILALAEKAQIIGQIIAAVNDIAEQTNLLALNAAIEASRAGEHGRGFSVVASEVKGLAEQSKKATAQVRQILSEIQKATTRAVLSTEQGTKTVTQAATVITQAGETIKKLAETLGGTAEAAARIVASAGQQGLGLAQVG